MNVFLSINKYGKKIGEFFFQNFLWMLCYHLVVTPRYELIYNFNEAWKFQDAIQQGRRWNGFWIGCVDCWQAKNFWGQIFSAIFFSPKARGISLRHCVGSCLPTRVRRPCDSYYFFCLLKLLNSTKKLTFFSCIVFIENRKNYMTENEGRNIYTLNAATHSGPKIEKQCN